MLNLENKISKKGEHVGVFCDQVNLDKKNPIKAVKLNENCKMKNKWNCASYN